MSLFSDIQPIRYDGPESTNDLAFRAYDATRIVLGRPMAEWLRCAVCYWHSFNWPGSDQFGSGTLAKATALWRSARRSEQVPWWREKKRLDSSGTNTCGDCHCSDCCAASVAMRCQRAT